MIDEKLIEMLRCPVEGGTLKMADTSLIAKVNQGIEHGEIRDPVGQRIEAPIEGGLVNEAGTRLYPIRNSIPTLVADEAILLGESE